MRRLLLSAALVCVPLLAAAQSSDEIISTTVSDHILPRFDALAAATETLSKTVAQDCGATSPALRTAYSEAFDAWIAASHLRFGPTEVNDRAFALTFWPDSRGVTPRTLAALVEQSDRAVVSAQTYREVSIAARGFYALEFLLYDPQFISLGDAPQTAEYTCDLVTVITQDIAQTSRAIVDHWRTDYAKRMMAPGSSDTYRTPEEVLQELLKALATGLQFTSDTRLGRPLGTFEKSYPLRAEAWRSRRSARHVAISLGSLADLAEHLAVTAPTVRNRIGAAFEASLERLDALDDPVFAGVAAPQTRLKVEVLQQSVDDIRDLVQQELGPVLGVAAGFNSLDGD